MARLKDMEGGASFGENRSGWREREEATPPEEERFEPVPPRKSPYAKHFRKFGEFTESAFCEGVETPEEAAMKNEEAEAVLGKDALHLSTLPALCLECDDLMPLCPNCRR